MNDFVDMGTRPYLGRVFSSKPTIHQVLKSSGMAKNTHNIENIYFAP